MNEEGILDGKTTASKSHRKHSETTGELGFPSPLVPL